MKKIIILIPILFLCMSFKTSGDENTYLHISKDILSRVGSDFYHFKLEKKNIDKIMQDSIFNEIDLNNDKVKEIIVKFNWFSDGDFGIETGFNYVRGAQDNGDWFIYKIKDGLPIYLGKMERLAIKVLPSFTNGYKEIEAYSHISVSETACDIYKYSDTKYKFISGSVIRGSIDLNDLIQ